MSHRQESKEIHNQDALLLLLVWPWASLQKKCFVFFTSSCGTFELQKNLHGQRCLHGIEPDSRVGQVLTQGQRLTLMTIDNNLSFFDFQPNSLLERGNYCLETASNKWSRRKKNFDKTSKLLLLPKIRLNTAINLRYIYRNPSSCCLICF